MKLVVFVIIVETNEGLMGKEPGYVRSVFEDVQRIASIEELRNVLGEDTEYKLDNYLTVWAAAEEPEAPPPEKETQVISSEEVGSVEEILTPGEGQTPEPVEAPETPAEEPQEPEKPAKSKRRGSEWPK